MGQHGRAGHVNGPGVLAMVSHIEAWAGDGVIEPGLFRAAGTWAAAGYFLGAAVGRGRGVWGG